MLNSTEDRRFNLSTKIMVYRQVQLLYLKGLGFGNANANICLFFESSALRAGQCDDGKSERFADLCCGNAVCGIARGAYAKQHIPGGAESHKLLRIYKRRIDIVAEGGIKSRKRRKRYCGYGKLQL